MKSRKKQKLLAEAIRPANVKVSAPLAWWLAKVALGQLTVVTCEDVAQALERRAESSERLGRRDRDLDAEDRFAASPGTAVEPMWSIRSGTSPRAPRISLVCSSKSLGHCGS